MRLSSTAFAAFVCAYAGLSTSMWACVAASDSSCLCNPSTFVTSALTHAAPAGGVEGVPGANVLVFNFDYSVNAPPGAIQDAVILAGQNVHWSWLEFTHTVTSVAGSSEVFDSTVLATPATFDRAFSQPGVFTYFCQLHGTDNGNGTASGMSGTITVLPVPEPAGAALLLTLVPALARTRRR